MFDDPFDFGMTMLVLSLASGVIAVIVWTSFAVSHAMTPRAHFENQCTAHHGIPDTHTNTWRCIDVR